MNSFIIVVASSMHLEYAQEICDLIESSAKERGTGIAKRSPEYIITKMHEGKAIIAIASNDQLAGFCYIESWGEKQYVANSGLIVNPIFRGEGLSRRIKEKAFSHSRKLFPKAKLFGLTTSLPVMKINSELGYVPVTYNQLTNDEQFWNGCKSCVNYEILISKEKRHCMCTAMLYDGNNSKKKSWNFMKKSKVYARFMALKKKRMSQIQALFL